MKQYIKLLIKQYLPFIVLSIISLCATTFISSSFTSVYAKYPGNITEDCSLTGFVVSLGIVLFIITSIGPLVANNYRNSLSSVDTYYQIGKRKNTIRYIHNLTILTTILISFTIAFIFGLIILLIRALPYMGQAIPQAEGKGTHYYATYNFENFIPLYFVFIIYIICNYAVSYFLVTRSNSFKNSCSTLVLGQVFLNTSIWAICLFLTYTEAIHDNFHVIGSSYVNFGFIGALSWINDSIGASILSNNLNNHISYILSSEGYHIVRLLTIISMIIYTLISVFSIFAFIYEKESTGELVGSSKGRPILQDILFHVGYFFILVHAIHLPYVVKTARADFLIFIVIFSSIAINSIIYYVIFCIFKHNFKPKFIELIPLLINITLMIGMVIAVSV